MCSTLLCQHAVAAFERWQGNMPRQMSLTGKAACRGSCRELARQRVVSASSQQARRGAHMLKKMLNRYLHCEHWLRSLATKSHDRKPPTRIIPEPIEVGGRRCTGAGGCHFLECTASGRSR